MAQWTYSGVLLFVLVASGWLEIVLRTRLVPRWRRWLLALIPGVVIFVAWDLYAIAAGHWSFAEDLVVGVVLPGGMPLEEALFFLIIPTAALLTFEAVRAVKDWPAGDEAG
jgi:lycopene cyclase domain-containing protein